MTITTDGLFTMTDNDAILPKTPDIEPQQTGVADIPVTPRVRPADPYIPEKSQKRDLSVGSTPSPTASTQSGKKFRSDTGEFDWTVMELESPDITLADVMAQLKLTAKVSDLEDVAKKKDLVELQGLVSANTVEIQQLRENLETQSKRIQLLEESAGRQVASMFSRTRPEVDVTRINKYGDAQSNPSQQNTRRQNLVFEGIPAMDNERDIVGFVVQLCAALEIIAYPADIEDVVPMRRRDGSDKPLPILVTFAQLHIRSAILRRKYKLANLTKFSSVFINPDEPVETRRAKAVFRRVGYQARKDGKSVLIRDDWIKINETQYRISDIDQIPDKYKCDLTSPTVSVRARDEPGNDSNTDQARPKKVKIKLTPAGLCFSGPSAYLSHMHRCSFTYRKNPYSSVEQGLHHQHAEIEGDTEIAAAMNIHNPYDFKDIVSKLPKSDKWAAMAPGIAWELNDAKFSQNPELKTKLLATAPDKLIEASLDTKWGGACPFGSDIYEQGQVPGRNLCGEQLTKYRDDAITEMSNYVMS